MIPEDKEGRLAFPQSWIGKSCIESKLFPTELEKNLVPRSFPEDQDRILMKTATNMQSLNKYQNQKMMRVQVHTKCSSLQGLILSALSFQIQIAQKQHVHMNNP